VQWPLADIRSDPGSGPSSTGLTGFAVKCTSAIAMRLLAVAERFCPDVVPEIRAAMEREQQ